VTNSNVNKVLDSQVNLAKPQVIKQRLLTLDSLKTFKSTLDTLKSLM